MEGEEYVKLAVEERCMHKLWKARVHGYEELTKLFRQIDDEKSPEFAKYLGLIKKFVVDNNALGQEKGLEVALAYIENYAHAGKTASEVMSGIVTKCMAAPKTKTRELALQVALMYIEIEKWEPVQEELIKGMEQKNPKIVSACIVAYTTALNSFGTKILNVKPLVKKLPVLLSDRDKTVRDESKLLAIEIYRWIGPAFKSQLNTLQPIQLTELETEFAKLGGEKAVPTRYIRSQQNRIHEVQKSADDVAEEEEDQQECDQIDAYDIADPVEILSKIPKDFYEKIEAKKWQERKEALEALEKLANTPKLEPGDYGELVRNVKKLVQKDSNVVVVALAGKCLAALATGLKKGFHPYSGFCVSALLEKFKEKKQNVVTAIREAIDAVYVTTNLEAISEDVIEALGNKNPAVKAETSMFLARALSITQPTVLNKKLLKALTAALVKNINEPDPNVRDCSAEALGTLMKLVGEKAIAPFLVDLEKDNLKMTKIKECAANAVIKVKIPQAKKAAPAIKTNEPKPVARPVKVNSGVRPSTRPGPQKSNNTVAPKGPGPRVASGPKPVSRPVERELTDEDVDEIISNTFSRGSYDELGNANWKNRLAGAEQMLSEIQELQGEALPVQAIVKCISRKPGLKDTNFQVLKVRLEIIKFLAENGTFTVTSADCCINDTCEKFGDPKNGQLAMDTMTVIAEAASLGHVASSVITFAMTQKNPKIMQEALLWLSNSLLDFGFNNVNPKLVIDNTKKALASSNPNVRQAAISLIGTMFLFMDGTLMNFFENEKPAIKDLINTEFDKQIGKKPPAPIRGIKKSGSSGQMTSSAEEGSGEPADFEPSPINLQDIVPRVDISGQITESLLAQLNDKNWKERNEALTKIITIIQEAKLIKPSLGDLTQALIPRLTDSNAKIAQTALSVCEAIARAMGPPARNLVRTFFPSFLQGLAENKAWMRTAALETINAFAEVCGYKEIFEGEMIADALKSGSPILRNELWAWLAEHVPKIPPKGISKEEIMICIPHLYTNLEDRNVDVRKNAQEAVYGFMLHTSYETMLKQTEKLKPGSKSVVIAILDKVRPNLPIKPLPKSAKVVEEKVSINKTIPGKTSTTKRVIAKPGAVPARKKEEEVDTSPLLTVNNIKHQRSIDESKLKVLKWNFTTPREEFVDLLKEQMTTANVNKTLIANMFHSDFRYHLKAIENLTDDLADNSEALISNLDLILKWLTLRFFDTNPSVLLKGLEYLDLVFEMLSNHKYKMLENEATSFIPYLILKIGDSKDTVRNGVKSLFKQIADVYSVSRLFTCIMDGVKSKNARQRAECLDVMALIISDYGLTVCVPSAQSCLKEVAKQISDRDNSVRSAALNCLVQAYNIVGEKIYKMVGNISDKDMSLLEERIKRASRKTIAKPLKEMTSPTNNSTIRRSPEAAPEPRVVSPLKKTYEEDEEEEEDEDIPQVTLPPQVEEQKKVVLDEDGPFKIDHHLLHELDMIKLARPEVNLKRFDLRFLNDDVKVPSLSHDQNTNVVPPIRNKTSTLNRTQDNILPSGNLGIADTISQMASKDATIALDAMDAMHELLTSNRSNLMLDYENEFMTALSQQLKHLSTLEIKNAPATVNLYRQVLTVLSPFYDNKALGRNITVEVLKNVIREFVSILSEGRLEGFDQCDMYVRVVNGHVVKFVERSDHTNSICALIQLLQESVRIDDTSRFTELVMKCLWKVIKSMPNWAADLDYSEIFWEVNKFLSEFPPAWWKDRTDTPLRTIKTIMHSSHKAKGNEIVLYLSKIPPNSEVEKYVTRLTQSNNSRNKQTPPPAPPPKVKTSPLSKDTQVQLHDIFEKIGIKEETKAGLNLLYDFVEQHPEVDIDPFLKQCSKFFQDYIKNGLKDIKDNRYSAKISIAEKVVEKVQASITPQTEENASLKGLDHWKENLATWGNRFNNSKLN